MARKKHHHIMQTGTRQLSVALTPDEIRVAGEELAVLREERARIDREFAGIKADFKSRITDNDERQDLLAATIRRKSEFREVGVAERINRAKQSREVLRLDTGEVIESRPLTVDELNLDLFPREVADQGDIIDAEVEAEV